MARRTSRWARRPASMLGGLGGLGGATGSSKPTVGGTMQVPTGCSRCTYKIGDDPNQYIYGEPRTTGGKPLSGKEDQ